MIEKLKDFLSNIPKNALAFWQSVSLTKKILSGAVLATIVSLIVALISQTKDEELSYLYKDLPQEDLNAITDELKKNGNTSFRVDHKGILVKPEQVVPLRLKLAEEGLPTHGQIGWEKFDQQDFTRTEFEQRIHKQRAIQGELARTISGIDGIKSARVHITLPKKSLFVEDQIEPSAAIYIRTKRGAKISEKQINGIVHLVSRSVEGMDPEKVTIIDQNGKMLTKIQTEDPTSKRTQEMLEYRRAREKGLEDKVRRIVSRIVGPERVAVQVDVEVDFTQEEQTINDIDPDKVVVLASNTTNQEMDGNGLNPTGIPGAKSNVPGEQEDLVVNQSRAKSKRASERLNYEIAKTQKKRLLAVGQIKRISAAVIVDGSQPYPADGSKPVFEPRTQEEMKKIEDIVKSTIGYQEKRDHVEVQNMLFELSPVQIEAIKENKEENRTYITTLTVSASIAVALVLFFAFIVRPYFRWLSYDPERKAAEKNVEEFKPDLDLGGIQNVQVKEDVPFEKLSPQEQILFLAKNEPERTTEAIRMLLNPHHNS